jgi:hypothetical protein
VVPRVQRGDATMSRVLASLLRVLNPASSQPTSPFANSPTGRAIPLFSPGASAGRWVGRTLAGIPLDAP